jgi:hypothetical protein
MQGYWQHPKLEFVTKNGVIRGYETLLNRYRTTYPNKEAMGTLEFSELEIEKLSNQYYLAIGKYTLLFEAEVRTGYFTILFRRIDGRWLMVKDHTS